VGSVPRPDSTSRLLGLLEQAKEGTPSHIFCKHLQQPLRRLLSQERCLSGTTSSLGQCYIAFGRLVTDLYVPDIPVDPAAIQSVVSQLSLQEHALLSSQIAHHVDIQQRDTGACRSAVIDYLAANLRGVEESHANAPILRFHRKRDVSQLHAFWSDVSQFLGQRLSHSMLEGLLTSLEMRDPMASAREQVVQESIAGFSQRLDSLYVGFEDLTVPLQISLLSTRLGIRLVAVAPPVTVNDGPSDLATALVAFPSISSADLLRMVPPQEQSVIPPFSYLLLALAAIGFERSIGIDADAFVDRLSTLYDQALRLWLIDRAKETDAAALSQSLYRRKVDYMAVSDAEQEEREFLALFPDFEDALYQARSPETGSCDQHTPLVQANQANQLSNLHLSIVNDLSDSVVNPGAMFMDFRRAALTKLLSSQMASLHDALDGTSRLFQSVLLHKSLTELQAVDVPESYNFYMDSNILQAKKAASVIRSLSDRLDLLTQEWPEQMVLQHLRGRCDLFLQVDLYSPVAKILSMLEQLLLQTEDWEIYANRDNTLKIQRQAMVNLVVEWRQLELSSWQGLLQSQAKSFADGALQWWFRLYDAIIRGILDASAHESRNGIDSTNSFLDELIPLLDDFMCTSPLGQFHTRLVLLRSFRDYAHLLAESHPNASALKRVFRVLHSTAIFYDMFTASLSTQLSAQKAALDKEIHAFIKLASWKDVNVQALKQSAQRTHRHIFKTIRKFRDVLRQPVTDRVQAELVGSQECQLLQFDKVARTSRTPAQSLFPEDKVVGSMHGPLADLGRTYKKMESYLRQRIQPFTTSITAQGIDSLAVEIIVRCRALSAETVSADSPEQRTKRQKALLVRKRKAWIDLLKELKRGGFAASVKREILDRQSNKRWILEQPVIPVMRAPFNSLERAENYLQRLHSSLSALRKLSSSPHSDLSARELQRGILLLESGFSMALSMRSWSVVPYDSLTR
jgi:midasin